MLTVKSARAPRWNNAEHTSLNLQVTFAETAETLGEMPFTASPEDNEAHGRDLFARAVALEFGPVQEPSSEVVAQATLRTLYRLQAQASATIATQQVALATLQDALRLELATAAEAATLPLKQAQLDAWCAYRVYLSRLDSQPGFPASVEWPAPPVEPTAV
ncbi:phage tail assembly chaperone [Pseudomonas silesiensis]|uniref:phage tail assembly chaperone n=1 Tax=Pseudomonas silesiensis TaxID=1853130 RepID=UPI0030CF338C